jgi:hypothetical protein
VSTTTKRAARQRCGRQRIAVVIPAAWLRRNIVEQLKAAGYQVCGTSSLSEAIALIVAGAIDVLLLHASTFPTAALSQLGRLAKGRRSVSLIAGVSVVSMTGPSDEEGVDREPSLAEARRRLSWRLSMYWLPCSRLTEFSAGLTAPLLN